MTYEPRREKKEKIPMSDIPSDWKYLCRKIRYFAWQLRHKWSVRLKARRTEQEMKRFVIVVVSLLMMVGFCDDRGIVKVRGRGTGTDKTEALKDAYRDAIEKAVGLYVDAEQMVKNEELVKDQILTQSNAYIEKYNIVIEGKSPSGLVTITILAEVRKRDLARKINDIMPSQKVKLSDVSKNLHAQIVTNFKANEDALSIIKNELKNLSPVKQLMKATLATTRPIVETVKEDPSLVRLWYPVKIEVDPGKYYNEFVPRWSHILDQIKVAPARRLDLKNNLKYVKLYNNEIAKDIGKRRMFGTTREGREMGFKEYWDGERDFSMGPEQDFLMKHGVALNEKYHGMTFFDVQIYGKRYMFSGLEDNVCHIVDWPDSVYITKRYFRESRSGHFYDFTIPEDCVFTIGLVSTAKGTTLNGHIYKIPYVCVKEIVEWQGRLAGVVTYKWYRNAPLTSFELSFVDAIGNEVAGCSFPVRNYDVLNFGCVLLEESGHGNGGTRLWLITPLVGGFAKSYIKWVNIDVPKDDVAKIATASISVEE